MDLAGYRPTLNEVAGLFGKSSRWISDLRAKGEMPADGATLGEFVAAIASYSAGQAGGIGAKGIDKHKARLASARADEAEMKNAQMREELLPRAGVTAAVQSAFARVRARLLALPSKAAPSLVTMKAVVPVQEKLTELVHEALAELAVTIVDAEPAGDDRHPPGDQPGDSGGREDVVAGNEAAAPSDGEPVGRPVPDAKPRRQRRTG